MEAVKQGSAAVGLKVNLVCPSLLLASHRAKAFVYPTVRLILWVLVSMQQGDYADSPARVQSDTHVVLATLKRAPSELSSFARKVFKIDDHLGIAASGLASDGRVLCRYMRNECINHRRAARFLCLVSQLCWDGLYWIEAFTTSLPAWRGKSRTPRLSSFNVSWTCFR